MKWFLGKLFEWLGKQFANNPFAALLLFPIFIRFGLIRLKDE